MYYVYYNDRGNITSVTTKINASNNFQYLEIDLQTYEDFMTQKKRIYEYIVVKNAKIIGKMHIVPRDMDLHDVLEQPTGIISKHNITENAVMLHQNITNGTWSASSTLDDINSTIFAQGNDHIKEYYVVDPTNRFILLDTFRINLKTLAAEDTINITGYNKEMCKQEVSLLCRSHHVKHIHIVED